MPKIRWSRAFQSKIEPAQSASLPHKIKCNQKPANGGESDSYFDRDPKGVTGGRVSACVCSSASQMGQDQISFKVPCSLNVSGCSTRLCEVHVAVGKPLRPVPWSSSIIFELPPGFEVLSLYPRIAIRRATLSKRKLERSFFWPAVETHPETQTLLWQA
jgi:hypothetical protein